MTVHHFAALLAARLSAVIESADESELGKVFELAWRLLSSTTFWSAASPFVALGITWWTIRHEQKVREEANRPWIVADIRIEREGQSIDTMLFTIQNSGASVARKVSVSTVPEMRNKSGRPIRFQSVAIPSLRAGETEDHILDRMAWQVDFGWLMGTGVTEYRVRAQYWDVAMQHHYEEESTIDMQQFAYRPAGSCRGVEFVAVETLDPDLIQILERGGPEKYRNLALLIKDTFEVSVVKSKINSLGVLMEEMGYRRYGDPSSNRYLLVAKGGPMRAVGIQCTEERDVNEYLFWLLLQSGARPRD